MKRSDKATTGFVLALLLLVLGCTDSVDRTVTHAEDSSIAVEPAAANDNDASFTATITRVKDGDSLVTVHGKTEVEIRLQGIDSPELGQAYGQKAKQATSQLAHGKTVAIKPIGQDRYGRTLADVILPDGRNLNQELVRQGYAWWFRKYSNDQTLANLEAEARKERRGLWADANPTAPWDWRDQQRNKGRQPQAEIKVVPNGVEIIALLPNPTGEDRGNEQVVIANLNEATVDLAGWKLQDRAGNVFHLVGEVPANGRLTIIMTDPSMPLNNDGDSVWLIDSTGVVRSQVAYTGSQSGQWVKFGDRKSK